MSFLERSGFKKSARFDRYLALFTISSWVDSDNSRFLTVSYRLSQ